MGWEPVSPDRWGGESWGWRDNRKHRCQGSGWGVDAVELGDGCGPAALQTHESAGGSFPPFFHDLAGSAVCWVPAQGAFHSSASYHAPKQQLGITAGANCGMFLSFPTASQKITSKETLPTIWAALQMMVAEPLAELLASGRSPCWPAEDK